MNNEQHNACATCQLWISENAGGQFEATAQKAKFLKMLLLLRVKKRLNTRSPISSENSGKNMSFYEMMEASQDAEGIAQDGVRLAQALMGIRKCEGVNGSLVPSNSKCIHPNKYISSS
ncbi:MAG: hypothetical protein UR89_C0034G0008 [Candidatus Roizmanbacteria bacterium GW2011_GWA2_35_8]|uniref:Uncharacterized protein n=1 Tax=Candidatus Roizmanbacteria bacterium GW2011_GWA2_35_8 TaxID=1618479 RepID=A0A0G0G319_9BACT|nr:MAG: hypothetical protein UR89_C0034G0008 [Candidatus Roizmanbacteria bacterium GW2011_GWA2_35_8]